MHMYVQVYSTVLVYVEVRDYHHVSSSIALLLVCLFIHSFIHLLISLFIGSQIQAWGSENNFRESVLSFYHVGLREQTQVIRLRNRCRFSEPSC